jgi:DNA-binding protein
LTSELGQARLLVAARGRELEAALSSVESTRMTAVREVESREEQIKAQREQLEQAANKVKQVYLFIAYVLCRTAALLILQCRHSSVHLRFNECFLMRSKLCQATIVVVTSAGHC